MMALTFHQPWASAIARGIKIVENRVWRSDFRGPLAIHAGKSMDTIKELRLAADAGACDEVGLERLAPLEPFESLRFGSLLGVVEVVDWVRYSMNLADLEDDPFASGPWCAKLVGARMAVYPKPWRGQQGLFEIPWELSGVGEWVR